ncbi:MAG: VWA domain-containing protein [Chloroflexota bacterium]
MRVWEKGLLICALISVTIFVIVRTLGAMTFSSVPPVSRIAHPGVVFWGERVEVELRVDALALPACPTKVDPAPVYVVLVIDHSGSMAGDPLTDARNAASDFLDLMNLVKDGDAASVVMFSDFADLLTGFSSDRSQVFNAIQNIPDGGGTDMASGLLTANQQFVKQTLPKGTRPLLILLSDGQSDPAAAIAAADQIKAQGIRLVAIALGSADLLTLSQIASSPTDYYAVSDPGVLMEIYGEIAKGYVGISATNLKLVEYFNDKNFKLAGGFYRAQQNGDQITWAVPYVGQRGRSVGYFLQPQSLGWFTISPKQGQLGLTDCNSQPYNQITPTGPNVLVIFPVWLLYIAPVLTLFWLIVRAISLLRHRPAFMVARPAERAGSYPGSKVDIDKKPNKGSDVTHGRMPPPKR